ncbi:lysosomal Pro-X carboxypeptidase-like protein [Tanacetum coccineum]
MSGLFRSRLAIRTVDKKQGCRFHEELDEERTKVRGLIWARMFRWSKRSGGSRARDSEGGEDGDDMEGCGVYTGLWLDFVSKKSGKCCVQAVYKKKIADLFPRRHVAGAQIPLKTKNLEKFLPGEGRWGNLTATVAPIPGPKIIRGAHFFVGDCRWGLMSDVFEVAYDGQEFIEDCKTMFGVTPQPHWATTYYGGHDIRFVLRMFGSNIIFSNGLRYPYCSGGVLEDISNDILAVKTTKDYDYALYVLIYLMADESDKNDDIRKNKPSLLR